MRSKFIDLKCLRLKWGKAIFVIPFTFWNKYIPCDPFLSLNKFSFMKKIPTRITPHTGGKWKFEWKKMKKLWESRNDKRAQETQWLGGMLKSQERVITKIEWVYPIKAMKKRKRANQRKTVKKRERNDTKSRTADSDPQSLKPWNTLWALWSFLS